MIVNDGGHVDGCHSTSEVKLAIYEGMIGLASEPLHLGVRYMNVENLAGGDVAMTSGGWERPSGGGEMTSGGAEMKSGDQESARGGDDKVKVNGGDYEELANGGQMEGDAKTCGEGASTVMG